MAGRRKQGNVVDMTKGSKRKAGGKRKDSKGEQPSLKPEAPEIPDHLRDAEAAVWKSVVSELERLNILSKIDGGFIETYVSMLTRYHEIKIIIEDEGYTLHRKTKTGTIIVDHPLLKHVHAHEKSLKAHAIEMGMTPASRSRVNGMVQKDLFENDFKDF